MEKLCEVRRRRISQIQKYLFPIQVNPIYQVLGTPPMKDNVVEKVQGNCKLTLFHLSFFKTVIELSSERIFIF